jgi:peroxiredoxin
MSKPAFVASLLIGIVSTALAAEPAQSPIGRKIENFSLRDDRGGEHALADFKESKLLVVAFLGTECPLAKLYAPRLAQLESQFGPQSVAFVGINANQQDSVTEIAHYARTHELKFPILKDVGNVVADQFGAIRTPEVFVLDSSRAVRYWGRIDDQYVVGVQRPKATRNDLAAALTELLAGKPVSQPVTQAVGCFIGRINRPNGQADVTYSREIARIFQQRCVECHRAGEIAPFSLTSYADATGWAETILEVIDAGRMPPWHADPKYGHFVNDARLSEEEKSLVRRWVRAGAPEGNPADLPPPRQFVQGWRIPEPDRVVYMSETPFTIKAEGEVRYQYFVVDPGFTEDKWVKAAECMPGNRAVVHHIIVGIAPPDGRPRKSGLEVDSDWLVATAPGARPLLLPEGYAKRIPAGSKLVFQMHYTPNGSVQQDRSSVGLVFADPAAVRKEVGTWKAATRGFLIPPHAENHKVEAWHTFSKDSLMLAMFPHMHLRGKSFRYEAQYPDGRSEILLDVPHYDFGWQNTYIFAEPKLMPAGTRLHCVAHFDNSENNLANPDPTDTVRWGDQTWEEMMIGYFDMALADQDLTKPRALQPEANRTDEFLKRAGEQKPALDEATRRLAAAALESDEAFNKLGMALQKLVPQADRMDLTTVKEGKLGVRRAVQAGGLRELAGGRGIEVRAAAMGLTRYAQEGKTVVHTDLSKARHPDLVLFGRVFSSSLHVPVTIDGDPGCISFWSREGDAFPPAAVELLEEAVRLMAK